MQTELINYINHYGYLVIFCFVFLQEIGVPGFPNEIALLYFGILSRQNILHLPVVLLLVITADFTGTFLVYILFYYCKPILKKIKPSWLPVPYKKIQQLNKNIEHRGWPLLLIGRLTPFIRGYISVATGLLKISPKKYVPVLIFAAICWTGGWVVLGFISSPLFNLTNISQNIFPVGITIIVVMLLLYFISHLNKEKFSTQN